VDQYRSQVDIVTICMLFKSSGNPRQILRFQNILIFTIHNKKIIELWYLDYKMFSVILASTLHSYAI